MNGSTNPTLCKFSAVDIRIQRGDIVFYPPMLWLLGIWTNGRPVLPSISVPSSLSVPVWCIVLTVLRKISILSVLSTHNVDPHNLLK